jgi:hypothetical protein
LTEKVGQAAVSGNVRARHEQKLFEVGERGEERGAGRETVRIGDDFESLEAYGGELGKVYRLDDAGEGNIRVSENAAHVAQVDFEGAQATGSIPLRDLAVHVPEREGGRRWIVVEEHAVDAEAELPQETLEAPAAHAVSIPRVPRRREDLVLTLARLAVVHMRTCALAAPMSTWFSSSHKSGHSRIALRHAGQTWLA